MDAALADPAKAELRPAVKAMFAFIEKMVKDAGALGPDDAAAARAAGIPDEGLRTAIHICAGFTMITRIADTFNFDIPPDEGFRASAKSLLKRGYVL